MDEQRQDDQKESKYNSSVSIQDVVLKTYRERWTIEKGGERGSGRSALGTRHHDDDIYSNLHIQFSLQVGWLFEFYDTSNLADYLMSNLIYMCVYVCDL